MRKNILIGSLLTCYLLIMIPCISSITVLSVENQLKENLQTRIERNNLLSTSLQNSDQNPLYSLIEIMFSSIEKGLQTLFRLMLSLLADCYYQWNIVANPVMCWIFESVTLFIFSVYIASCNVPMQNLCGQAEIICNILQSLPSFLRILLSLCSMIVFSIEPFLIVTMLSMFVFIVMMLYRPYYVFVNKWSIYGG